MSVTTKQYEPQPPEYREVPKQALSGVRQLGADAVLQLCAALARDGIKNPLLALQAARETVGDAGVDHRMAMRAAMDAAGGSLVRWYGLTGEHRTLTDTAELFEEALFRVQVGSV